MSKTEFKICTEADTALVHNLLWALREEFFFADQAAVFEITRSYMENGAILGGFQNGEMVAALGYFAGDPNHDFVDKEIVFISLIAIAPAVRRSWVAFEGTRYMVETFRTKGIKQFRFHARESDPYTNKMYGLIAQLVGQTVNTRGYLCNVYEAKFDDFVALLDRMSPAAASVG